MNRNYNSHSGGCRSSYDYRPPSMHSQQQQHRPDRDRSPIRDGGGGDRFSSGRAGGGGGAALRTRVPDEPLGWEHDETVRLDLYNSDLWLMIETDGFTARPVSEGGFANMWAGAQATYAARRGRVYYEVRIGQHNRDVSAPPEERLMFLLRCGWSTLGAGMVLGEEPLSYGYGGSGKASTNSQFKDYGGPFDTGDVVGCFLEYRDDGVPVISYSLNGRSLGVCYTAEEARNKPLFPHLLAKNVQFEANFGQRKPWYPPSPADAWIPIGQLTARDRQRNYLPPAKREDCTMLMMCGLPAAGKSVWAEKHRLEHPDSRYCLLGTNSIIDRLKVTGLPRQRNYHGRWEMLIERATKCLNALFEIACRRKRNYILDQTNVYASAQRRKMAPFDGCRRVAVVVVPEHGEYLRRLDRQRQVEGKEVPEHAIAAMKANFSIPSERDGLFDDVLFTELPRGEAEQLVSRYNKECAGAAATGGGGGGSGRGGGGGGGGYHQRPFSNYDAGRRGGHSRGGYDRQPYY